MNVWSALTSAFKAATSSKRRELRVLDGKVNPCVGVEPPGDKASRKARRKPFVYPRELATLLACADVSREWRELHAIAAMTYLRPGELRVLRWTDVDLDARLLDVSKAWDYAEAKVKAPKTSNGNRKVPIEPSLAPLLERMKRAAAEDALVVPLLAAENEDTLAATTRAHLKRAGVKRAELFPDANSRTHVAVNFRSWRDSGITWLALSGVDVVRMQRRAGHEQITTTMGYVKLAEDHGADLGTPFGPLPKSLLAEPTAVHPTVHLGAKSAELLCEGRDLNPYRSYPAGT